jgi:ABC-2 type transport system ATP-binding protein
MALVIAAGFMVFHSSLRNDVPTVDAQLSPASPNTTVVNNVTVAPGSISLGSTVHANGQVTVGTTPLANAAVSLHIGDVILASAQTNGNGQYAFAAPVGVYYFPAAFSNGATIYTVVEPGNTSLASTPSAVTTVSVDLIPFYLIIAAVTGAILIGLYLFARQMGEKAVVRDATALKRAHEQCNYQQDQTDWAVEIDGLAKSYGSTKAVDHISFSIPFGVIFAFLGPNGAGKTTTVEMLECLRKPSAGAAYVLGLDVTKDQNEIRKRIGVMPQDFNTFDRLTVRESLKYYATMYENSRDIDELIVSVDLADQANTQYKNLSGGLKQRVGVAIALVNDPEVVFLDEPTEGLDPKSRRRVWEVITKQRDEGKTVFLTTHYMEEAETLADIVAIILDGKIKAMDKTPNLINNHGLQTKIVIHGGGTEAFEALGAGWKGTELNNDNVIVPMSDKKDLARIAELLDQHQVAFDDLEMRRPSLEDVFLELTRAHEEATL